MTMSSSFKRKKPRADKFKVRAIQVLLVESALPPKGAVGERPEFDIKLPLGAPLLIFPRSYLLKCFPQGDTSARQREFEIRILPVLGELTEACEPCPTVCQLYC